MKKFRIKGEITDTVEFYLEKDTMDNSIVLMAQYGDHKRAICSIVPQGSLKVFGETGLVTEVDVRDFLRENYTAVRVSDIRVIEDAKS